MLLTRRRAFGLTFFAFCLASLGLTAVLGQDFFPSVDGSAIRLHMRAATGTRVEETARIADEVDRFLRQTIPADELETILDNIGLPYSGINLSYSNSGVIGTLDAEILIALKEGHRSARVYIDELRRTLPAKFPGVEFFFQPADIVTQILNFGLPAAIDVQFLGQDMNASFAHAARMAAEIRKLPGAVDVHIHQRLDQPSIRLDMDRTRMQQVNINANTMAQNVLISLSGSQQTAPAFWLSPQNSVSYNVTVQTPQYQISSVDDLMRTPVISSSGDAQIIGNLAQARPAVEAAVMSRYNLRPAIDIYVSVEGRDLGGLARDIGRLVDETRPNLPRGYDVFLRGQAPTHAGTPILDWASASAWPSCWSIC